MTNAGWTARVHAFQQVPGGAGLCLAVLPLKGTHAASEHVTSLRRNGTGEATHHDVEHSERLAEATDYELCKRAGDLHSYKQASALSHRFSRETCIILIRSKAA